MFSPQTAMSSSYVRPLWFTDTKSALDVLTDTDTSSAYMIRRAISNA
jgi:hypothetical protein